MRVPGFLFLTAILSAPNSFGAQIAECESYLVVDYSTRAVIPLGKFSVGWSALNAPESPPLSEKMSPQGTAKLVVVRVPEFLKKGPWNTRAQVIGGKGRRTSLRLEALDHSNKEVQFDWLSEKLLFVRVWWGRMVSHDIVLNVDTGQAVYHEEATHKHEPANCERKPN